MLNSKKLLLLSLIIMIFFVMPITFATDIDNTTEINDNYCLTENPDLNLNPDENIANETKNDDFDCVLYPKESEINYHIEDHHLVTIYNNFYDNSSIGKFTARIDLNETPLENATFSMTTDGRNCYTFNLFDYNDKFIIGETYTITAHPIDEFSTLNAQIKPMTIHVLSQNPFDFISTPEQNIINNYTEGENCTIRFNVNYNEKKIFLYPDEIGIKINDTHLDFVTLANMGIFGGFPYFDLNLGMLKLTGGKNYTITSQPYNDMSKFKVNITPLIVNVLPGEKKAEYISTPIPSEVNYTIGTPCKITVNVESKYFTYDWTKDWTLVSEIIDFEEQPMYAYINNETYGILLEGINASQTSFKVDLNSLNYPFKEGNQYNITFHPDKKVFGYVDSPIYKNSIFNNLTVHTYKLKPIYTSTPSETEINYTPGKPYIIHVYAEFNESLLDLTFDDLEVFINGTLINTATLAKGIYPEFLFNINELEYNFTSGETYEIKFQPKRGLDEINTEITPLIVHVLPDKKASSIVKANNTKIIYGENINISIYSENATEIKYQLIKDGEIIQENTTKNSIQIKNLSAGNYTLNLTTVTDENHTSATNTSIITVKKANIDMVMPESINVTIGDKINLPVTIGNSQKINEGFIAFYINDKLINNTKVINNSVNLKFTPTTVGIYNIIIIFTSNNFNDIVKSTKVCVNPIQTKLLIENPEKIYLDETITAHIHVSHTITGELKYFINNEITGILKINNGTCIITYTPNTTGEFSLFALYEGDNNYGSSYAMTSFKVVKNTTLTVSPSVKLAYGSKTIIITLKDQSGDAIANSYITCIINGETKTLTTNKNGQATLSTKGLNPKNYYKLVATFNGNNTYLKSTATSKIVITKATPKITAAKKTFKVKTKTKKYTINLKVNNKAMKNAKVYIKVNGKTYSGKTNSKGKLTFKITKLNKKGKFIAKLTYKGNKYYQKISKKAIITVK